MGTRSRPYDKNPRLAPVSTVKSEPQEHPNLSISSAKHGDDHSLPADQIDSDTEGDAWQDEEEEGEEDEHYAAWICRIFDLEQENGATLAVDNAEASGSGPGRFELIKVESSTTPPASEEPPLKKGKWSKDDAWTLVMLVQKWGKNWKAIGGELRREPKVSSYPLILHSDMLTCRRAATSMPR
jgi:hypothetical protein